MQVLAVMVFAVAATTCLEVVAMGSYWHAALALVSLFLTVTLDPVLATLLSRTGRAPSLHLLAADSERHVLSSLDYAAAFSASAWVRVPLVGEARLSLGCVALVLLR